MSYGDAIVMIVIVTVSFLLMSMIATSIMPTPNPMVVKIMRGDLPQCNETVGTPDGYYCQVNNASFFCKVDATQPDPFVRTHAYCQEVVFV